jgi:hypothetical protein
MTGGDARVVEPARHISAYALVAFVLGILGFWPLLVIGPVLAIVFSGLADREIAHAGGLRTGEAFAQAGRILGIIALILDGLLLIAVVSHWSFRLPLT